MFMKNQNGTPWVSIIYVLFLLCPLFSGAQQIIQVGAGEYCTVYRTNTERVFLTRLQGSTFSPVDLGLSGIKQVHGGQYTVTARSATGTWIIGERNPQLITPVLDSAGNPFAADYLHCIYQSNIFIKGGKIWYQGIDDVLNQNNGAFNTVPRMLINPAGKTFVKIVSGSATTFGSLTRMWALASDGTIWQWDRTRTSPVQVIYNSSLSDPARDIAMLGANAEIIETNSGNFWVRGYLGSYAGGVDFSSTFTNVKSVWTAAGVVFPTKEIATNYNTIHLIDSKGNHFASGSNVQGNIGNGKEMNPWKSYSLYGNASPYQWGFDNFQVMQTPTWIPGKIKNITSSNTVAFYFYAQDEMNNWYSWGRNKSRCLGNGITMNAIDEAQRSDFINVPAPKKVTPLTQTWTILPAVDINAARLPVANAGIDQLITTDTTSLYGFACSQQGATLSSYSWTKISGPDCNIANPSAANTKISGLTIGTYVFRISVTNANGATAQSDVTIIRNGNAITNTSPSANAGNNQTITLPVNSVTLSGTGTDTDGTITGYNWSKISGPATFTITNSNNAQTTVTGLIQGTYTFQLKITDNDGGVAYDTLSVNVLKALNILPVANAGSNQTITLPVNLITLSGNATDADGTIASFYWTKISGPTTFAITNAALAQTTVTGLLAGTYLFKLTVTDNSGGIHMDTIQVIVNPAINIIPAANAGTNQMITLPVNTVSLSGTGTDTDGTIVSYNWTKTSGPASFSIMDATNAQTTVTALAAGNYIFKLTVTDNDGATASSNVTITVNPALNVPPVANAGNDQMITLPANTILLNGNGVDTDGTIVSYNWTKTSGPASFSIMDASNAGTTVTALVAGNYIFKLTVTDNNGATASSNVTITVNPALNVPPTASAGNDQTITLPLNTITLSGTGTDSDGTIVSYAWTKISGPNSFSIAQTTAAETRVTNLSEGTYTFELTVTDNNGSNATSHVDVIVYAAPNIAPVAIAGNDTTILASATDIILYGSGSDEDGTIVNYHWSLLAGDSITFSNASSAQTTITGLNAGVYNFELTVTDNDGAISSDTISVTVIAPVYINQPPLADGGADKSITIPTTSANLTGSSTDLDGYVVLNLWRQLSGPTNATIASSNSVSTTVSGLTTEGFYYFEFTATDNNGAQSRDTVKVAVAKSNTINQLPVANAGNDQQIYLPTSVSQLSGTATDADGWITAYKWSKLSGPSGSKFQNASAANTRVTGLKVGTYTFVLAVTDNRRGNKRDTIVVDVLSQLTGRAISSSNNSNFGSDLEIPALNMNIWPIPATTEMNVQINGLEAYSSFTATLVDAAGNNVYNMMGKVTSSTMQISIPVTNLHRGTYFLRVVSNGKSITSKVLKM